MLQIAGAPELPLKVGHTFTTMSAQAAVAVMGSEKPISITKRTEKEKRARLWTRTPGVPTFWLSDLAVRPWLQLNISGLSPPPSLDHASTAPLCRGVGTRATRGQRRARRLRREEKRI